MSLRLAAKDARIPVVPRMQSRVAEQAAILATRFDRQRTFSTDDADALIARLRSAAHQERWGAISFREWKIAAWLLHVGREPLASEPNFLRRLFREYRVRNRRSAYLGLMLAFLSDYDPKIPAMGEIAREIRENLSRFNWEWSTRHERFGLFSPEEGPGRVAKACLLSDKEPADVLADAGMGGGRSYGGFAGEAYRRALGEFRAALEQSQTASLEKILRWSVREGVLTYPGHRGALAESLLGPWASRAPDEQTKERISRFLLAHFKDPRLPVNAKHWIGVDKDAVAVLRKWLTGVALEQFFVVVDQVAHENMWRFRRAFWLAYYNKGVVDDAWVLFGVDAQTYARRAFGNAQSFGVLERGAQVQHSHSVLLMKIGKLIVSEWSHSGRCYIWLDGTSNAPKLYNPSYARDELIRAAHNDGGQVHHGSEYGTWQKRVETYIRRHTSIALEEREYMPRGWKR